MSKLWKNNQDGTKFCYNCGHSLKINVQMNENISNPAYNQPVKPSPELWVRVLNGFSFALTIIFGAFLIKGVTTTNYHESITTIELSWVFLVGSVIMVLVLLFKRKRFNALGWIAFVFNILFGLISLLIVIDFL